MTTSYCGGFHLSMREYWAISSWSTSNLWLRTNGVNTNGVAAKVMLFDGLGEKYARAFLGNEVVLRATKPKSKKQQPMKSEPPAPTRAPDNQVRQMQD